MDERKRKEMGEKRNEKRKRWERKRREMRQKKEEISGSERRKGKRSLIFFQTKPPNHPFIHFMNQMLLTFSLSLFLLFCFFDFFFLEMREKERKRRKWNDELKRVRSSKGRNNRNNWWEKKIVERKKKGMKLKEKEKERKKLKEKERKRKKLKEKQVAGFVRASEPRNSCCLIVRNKVEKITSISILSFPFFSSTISFSLQQRREEKKNEEWKRGKNHDD